MTSPSEVTMLTSDPRAYLFAILLGFGTYAVVRLLRYRYGFWWGTDETPASSLEDNDVE
jgi:hypothetical protein